MQRARAEKPQSERRAGLDERPVERALMLGLDPDLVAEVAREADAPDERRHEADLHPADGEQRESLVRHVVSHDAREEIARLRPGHGKADEVDAVGPDRDGAVGQEALEPAHVTGLGDA
jgi:hypothetical protein